MTDAAPQTEPTGETDQTPELRALLVRLLIQAGPGDARLEQLLTALEPAAKPAAEAPDGHWPAELISLKADIAALREGIAQHTPLQELLARSDAQLAAVLTGAEQRTQARLAQLGAQVSVLTERVSQLEGQIKKLTRGS